MIVTKMPFDQQFADRLIAHVRSVYGDGFIPLHRPVFEGNERQYLVDTIDSNFVSSVGERVTEFENRIAEFAGAKYAVATVNGTTALHTAMLVAGVQPGDEVLTQALSFVATCNAIVTAGAHPVFVDVDRDTMGLSPTAVEKFIHANYEKRTGGLFNISTGRRLAACIPMHTFGHPVRIHELVEICAQFGITLIEDAAESLGSYVGDIHTGHIGKLGVFSFNGNKVITTGGGGMIVTDDEALARHAKHLTTTAKTPHAYEFIHDEVGFNYRMPNLNAALGVAQLERLPEMLEAKRKVAQGYSTFFSTEEPDFFDACTGVTMNYWINAICLNACEQRDSLLVYLNENGVMSRPIWKLMSQLPMYKDCPRDNLTNSIWLEQRIINIPSSVPDGVINRSDVML
jgi:perosamine synthetase